MSQDPYAPRFFRPNYGTVHPQTSVTAMSPPSNVPAVGATGVLGPDAPAPGDVLTLPNGGMGVLVTPVQLLSRDVGCNNNNLPVLRFYSPNSSSPIVAELTDGNELLAQITRDGKILLSRKCTVLFNQVLRHGALPEGFGEAPTPLREPGMRELDLNQEGR
jgi:hypothetical protein